MSYTIKQTFRVEIGHRTWTQNMLTSRGKEFYDRSVAHDKCANLHGHTLFISITLQGETLDQQYFLMDTDLLGGAFRPVVNDVDHAFVVDRNDPLFPEIKSTIDKGGLKVHVVDFSPTFEALAKYFHDRLKAALTQHGHDKVLKIKEMKLLGEQTVEATYFDG